MAFARAIIFAAPFIFLHVIFLSIGRALDFYSSELVAGSAWFCGSTWGYLRAVAENHSNA